MIEWIIFGVLALIISETLFLLVFRDEDEWIASKIASLMIGVIGSGLLFLLPYSIAYNCEWWEIGETCTNYGIQFFYWLYGIIAGIVLFFLINKWLLKKVKGGKK